VAYLSQPNSKSEDPARLAAAQDAGVVTTFGPGMLITGNIVSAGSVHVFGRVKGDIHAAQLAIAEGGRVEGQIRVREAVINGFFKGTLYGDSVKLQGTAVVEGEVHNKSLSIGESAIFEGVARRLERPVEVPRAEAIAKLAPAVGMSFDESDTFELAPDQIVSAASDIDHEVIA